MCDATGANGYRAPGVIEGLHFHKEGQHRSRRKATVITCLLFLVVVLIGLLMPSSRYSPIKDAMLAGNESGLWHTRQTSASYGTSGPAGFRAAHGSSPPGGYVGRVTVIPDGFNPPVPYLTIQRDDTLYPPSTIPEQIMCSESYEWTMGPGDFCGDPGSAVFPASASPPLWHYTLRNISGWGMPPGLNGSVSAASRFSKPPHVQLANPDWPHETEYMIDSAVVEGYLILHSYGLVSFQLEQESHPKLGFAREVRRAIQYSVCYPATDETGERITVRCPYRCVFMKGNKPSVSVSNPDSIHDTPYKGSMTAKVRE